MMKSIPTPEEIMMDHSWIFREITNLKPTKFQKEVLGTHQRYYAIDAERGKGTTTLLSVKAICHALEVSECEVLIIVEDFKRLKYVHLLLLKFITNMGASVSFTTDSVYFGNGSRIVISNRPDQGFGWVGSRDPDFIMADLDWKERGYGNAKLSSL